MSLDGFLTLLAIFIAIYTVASPVERLRFRLNIEIQRLIALLAIVFILYFEFFSLVSQPCYLPSNDACAWLTFPRDGSFTPPQAAFLVAFAWIILACGITLFRKPRRNSLTLMRKMVEALLYGRRFPELVDFIQPNLGLIETTAKQQPQPSAARAPLTKRRLLARRSNRIIQSNINAHESATTIVQIILNSDEFRKFLVTERPNLLSEFMAIDLIPRFNFSEKALRDLISEKSSRLYEEIEHNQNIESDFGYRIERENFLLRYLFEDAEVSQQLGAWKPVGDFVLNKIRTGTSDGYIAYLNDRPDDFCNEKWRDVVFVGIRYFDIMVNEAMRQDIHDHMWLYYVEKFVRELEIIYDTSSTNVDIEDEFPTRSAYLLYEAFDVMCRWVENIKHLPENALHATIPEEDVRSSGAIPIEAAVAIGQAMATVARSDRIDDRFAS